MPRILPSSVTAVAVAACVSPSSKTAGVVQLGEAEVEHPKPALAVDHDVVRFEIAVGDARAVGAADRVGEGNCDLQQLPSANPFQATSRKRPSFDQLHGDEVDAVRLFDGMDGHDVGVVQGGDGPGLAFETRLPFRIRSHFFAAAP